MTIPLVWAGLRSRRIAVASTLGACLPLAILLPTPWGTLLAIGSVGIAFAVLRAWPCPRCARRFAGAGLASWPDYCTTCALPAYASLRAVQEPVTRSNPAGEQLSPRLRRFVAATQILGGASIMITVAVSSTRMSWWILTLAESLGFLAMFSGWLLWRDHREGYRLTRALQWCQLVKAQGSAGTFAVAAGFSTEIVFTTNGFSLAWNQNAMLFIGTAPQPFYLAVNIFALILLVLLAGAKPAARDVPQVRLEPAIGVSASDGSTV